MVVARREDELLQLADEMRQAGASEVVPIVGDISVDSVRANIHDRIRDQWGALDLLINNAGISAHGRFENSTA